MATDFHAAMQYVAVMVTRIHKHVAPRLFLKEHREARGISADAMAGRLGIERESVYRLEKKARTRLNPEKQQQYADALGIKPWRLWRPPGPDSLDDLIEDASDEVKSMAVDIVRRLVAGKR